MRRPRCVNTEAGDLIETLRQQEFNPWPMVPRMTGALKRSFQLQLLSQPLGVAHDAPASAATDNRAARLAFLVAGALLSLASVSLAALNGWSRGASIYESLIWSGAGIALALVSLFGLSLMLTHHGQARRAAGLAWALGLSFTLVAALGSQHGGRELATRTEGAAVGDHARHQADYDRATAQLAKLPETRPVGVIQQELAVLLQDERLKGCAGWLDSARLRKVCDGKVAPARTELANAQARETAQAAMTAAGAALGSGAVAKPANSDASAVRRYLSAIGIHVGADRLADLLNLLTVFAVEFCGSASLALARRATVHAEHQQRPSASEADATAADSGPRGGSPRNESAPDRPSPLAGTALDRAAADRRTQIVDRLKSGALEGRQVDIATALGVPKTTLRRIVESDSRLRMVAGPQGSRLELV